MESCSCQTCAQFVKVATARGDETARILTQTQTLVPKPYATRNYLLQSRFGAHRISQTVQCPNNSQSLHLSLSFKCGLQQHQQPWNMYRGASGSLSCTRWLARRYVRPLRRLRYGGLPPTFEVATHDRGLTTTSSSTSLSTLYFLPFHLPHSPRWVREAPRRVSGLWGWLVVR